MEELIPLATHLIPVISKLIGGKMRYGGAMLNEVGGRRRRRTFRRRGGNLIGGGDLIGGRYRMRMRRGKGFIDTVKKIAAKVSHYGRKAYELYNNKHVRSLVKHGLNTYRTLNTGKGRRRRMKYVVINKMRTRGGAMDNPPGPLA